MAAVGVIVAGVGVYLMYYAVRKSTNHPILHAQTALRNVTAHG